MKNIKFDKDALSFIDELAEILLDKEYFSFIETADNYIEDLVRFIIKNIHIATHKPAPAYFSKFGKNLFYIAYKRNKNTTWYIFFEKTEYHYLIRHISNNHVIGKHLR